MGGEGGGGRWLGQSRGRWVGHEVLSLLQGVRCVILSYP